MIKKNIPTLLLLFVIHCTFNSCENDSCYGNYILKFLCAHALDELQFPMPCSSNRFIHELTDICHTHLQHNFLN